MIGANTLVLYKQDAAVVTEKAEKLTLETKGGSMKVREKDVTVITSGVPSLKVLTEKAAAFAKKPDLEAKLSEAWELLAEDAGKLLSFSELGELAFGTWESTEAFGVFSALASSPYFTQTSLAVSPDSVLTEAVFAVRPREEVEAAQQKARIREGEGEKRRAFLERLKSKQPLLPEDAPFMQEVEAVALGQSTKSKVLSDLGIRGGSGNTPGSYGAEGDDLAVKAHRLLLDTNFWGTHKNPYPARYGLSSKSAREALGPPPEESRTTITHRAFAIDNEWSTDPDDAVFFDGANLWVHIADPASSVTPDSPIDLSARNRGATLYLPEGAARMLAEESLADYALGLSKLSCALSFKIPLTLKEGGLKIAECEVVKTLVPVVRLSYEEAAARREEPELSVLFAIAEANRRRREANGATSITLPEVHIHLEGSDIRIEKAAHNIASDMVQEMMLLAGEAAAKFAYRHKIPFPYASQEAPVFPPDIPQGLAGEFQRVKCMQKKTVSTAPGVHSGLALTMYSQVTSPLRRYGDLVAHQQLRAFLDGKPLLDTETVLERILQGDAAAAAGVKAERKTNLHWTLVYLLEHPEWTGEAVAVDFRTPYAATVLIPELARQTVVTTAKKAALNDVLHVKAGKISLPEQSFVFVEV